MSFRLQRDVTRGSTMPRYYSKNISKSLPVEYPTLDEKASYDLLGAQVRGDTTKVHFATEPCYEEASSLKPLN